MNSFPSLSAARWYDITIPLQSGIACWPGDTPFEFRQTLTMEAGESVNVGSLTLSVHTGTHVDAPAHFRQGADSTSKIDLTALVGPVCVVDARGQQTIGPEVFAGLDLSRTPRILVATGGWDDHHTFPTAIPTLTPDAVTYLADQGVRLVGVDVPSVDALDSKDLPIHHALYAGGITFLEGLDLRDVPPGRYHLIALPLPLAGADGAPVRAILVAGPDAP